MRDPTRSHTAPTALAPGEPSVRRPGQSKRRCGASTDHGPCKRWVAPGALRCNRHGGLTPQAKARAEQRAAAESLGALMGTPVVVNPTHALLQQVYAAAGTVEHLRALLESGQTMTRAGHQARALSPAELAYVRGELAAERERLVKFSKTAIDAGLAERTVALAEATTRAIVAVVAGLLDSQELNLTGVQKLRGREIAHRLLLQHSEVALLPERAVS